MNLANIMYFRTDELIPNKNNPYKIDPDELKALEESIKELDILQPLIARPTGKSGCFELISGHRRLQAAKNLNMERVPVKIVEATDDEANIMLVDSNTHREKISYSERAFAYKLKMDALSHQGKATDETCARVVYKSVDKIAEDDNTSRETVRKFIRLTNLIPELLDMVDEKKIAFTNGVELSYLPDDKQYVLLSEIEENDCVPSYSQAVRLKKLSQANNLPDEMITEIMLEPKANQVEMFKIPMEQIRKLVPNLSEKQMQDFVMKACEHYRKYLIRQQEREL